MAFDYSAMGGMDDYIADKKESLERTVVGKLVTWMGLTPARKLVSLQDFREEYQDFPCEWAARKVDGVHSLLLTELSAVKVDGPGNLTDPFYRSKLYKTYASLLEQFPDAKPVCMIVPCVGVPYYAVHNGDPLIEFTGSRLVKTDRTGGRIVIESLKQFLLYWVPQFWKEAPRRG